MAGPSETLLALEQRFTERPLAFERLDEAWPRGRTAIERAEIGRHREDALSGIEALAAPAAGQRLNQTEPPSPETLEVRKAEEPEPHALLAPPDARRLVASVLAAVEREADGAAETSAA